MLLSCGWTRDRHPERCPQWDLWRRESGPPAPWLLSEMPRCWGCGSAALPSLPPVQSSPLLQHPPFAARAGFIPAPRGATCPPAHWALPHPMGSLPQCQPGGAQSIPMVPAPLSRGGRCVPRPKATFVAEEAAAVLHAACCQREGPGGAGGAGGGGAPC